MIRDVLQFVIELSPHFPRTKTGSGSYYKVFFIHWLILGIQYIQNRENQIVHVYAV